MKTNFSDKFFDVFNVIFMGLLAVLFILPFVHLFFASISDPVILTKTTGLILWPKGDITFKGYLLTMTNRGILTGYLNTIFYLVVGTVVNMFFTVTTAYALSRKKVMFGNFVMFLLVFTMFLDGGLIPYYLQVRKLGLYNNRLVMILPGLVTVMNVIIVRTAFSGIDKSLSESAKIDGAGHFTILFKIIVPVSKATLSVIALFYAVYHWNSWFNASIFLRDRTKFPLQLILREILVLSNDSVKNELMMEVEQMDYYKPLIKYSVVIVATVPILIVYPFIQRFFTKGVMIGAIKG